MGVGRRSARSASDSTLRRKKKPAESSSLAGNWIVSPAPEIYSVTNYTTNTFAATPRAYFNHALWHLFVLAGSACHYVAVIRYILPHRGV